MNSLWRINIKFWRFNSLSFIDGRDTHTPLNWKVMCQHKVGKRHYESNGHTKHAHLQILS